MSTKCLHSQHGFKVYGQSTYSEATCPKCLLSAYNTEGGNFTHESVFALRKERENDKNYIFSKSKCPTPLTDTVSHFPSPGGEVQCNVYQPHLPLLNCVEEIRPSEVPEFTERLKYPTEDILNRCKSPWEQRNIDKKKETVEVENEEKPSVVIDSATEQKLKDISYGQKLLRDKERLHKLANEQFYKSSTQKFYEGVDWRNIIKTPRPAPLPPPCKEDKSELEGQIKRYYGKNEDYQRLTDARSWDFVQTRDGHYVKRPIAYMSESKKTNQIPSYGGSTSGLGEKDIENETFTPLTILRTDQPKFSNTGRKPHILGYTGCVLSGQYREVFSNEPLPRRETTARVHSRFNTYPMNKSKYSHQSPLSNNISLTHPFNPFNHLAPSTTRTVRSGTNAY